MRERTSYPEYLRAVRQKGKRYFTLEDAVADLCLPKNVILAAMYRLKMHGELISPAKGLYIIVPPEHQPEGSIPAGELVPILMKYLKADYYVSLLTAAMYHGATHQKARRFQIISDKRVKHSLAFGQVELELTYKKSLKNLPTMNIAVSTGYLTIATPELTTMDLLFYQAKCGGLNHIATVLSELIEAIDPDKLINLAESSEEKAWLQRLGYILEKIDLADPDKTKIITDKLEQYLRGNIKSFVPLAPEISRVNFSRCKRWMIIENTSIESDL